jgi:hypothetical protein
MEMWKVKRKPLDSDDRMTLALIAFLFGAMGLTLLLAKWIP